VPPVHPVDEILALRDQRNRTVQQALDECGEALQTGTFVVVSPGRIRVAGPPLLAAFHAAGFFTKR
jgi:aromatic ring-opening dioxygenase LigB subunit